MTRQDSKSKILILAAIRIFDHPTHSSLESLESSVQRGKRGIRIFDAREGQDSNRPGVYVRVHARGLA